MTITLSRSDMPAAAPRRAHDPRPEIRTGIAIVGLFALGFAAWSASARFDAAVTGPGVVQVAGHSQALQSATTGIVSALRVRDGQEVKAGQVLVQLATTDELAQERSYAGRVFGLQAEIARINAERSGKSVVTAPGEWVGLSPADQKLADQALAGEQANLVAAHNLIASQESVLRQRITQASDQISGYRERQVSNNRQNDLNAQELNAVQSLYEKGYAPRSRVFALQRTGAALQGEMGSTRAEMARLRSVAGEAKLQIIEVSQDRLRSLADRLNAAQTELQTVLPQWRAAREQLARREMRAPVTGTVVGLAANSIGNVVGPGQKILEIVPKHGSLVVEAKIALSDANDLRAGHPASVHVQGMRGRYLKPLTGTVAQVSADSRVDEKTGNAYYTARVDVPQAELDRVSREAGISGSLRPGTPVQVVVTLRTRSAIGYWIEPLTERLSGAFSGG